jgi:DNA-binding response OmpR family regulator
MGMANVTGWGDTAAPPASRVVIVGDASSDLARVMSLLHEAGHRVVHYDPLARLLVIGASAALPAAAPGAGSPVPGGDVVVGGFTLDPSLRTLRVGKQSFALTPRQFNVMLALMRSPEHTLTREELCKLAGIRSAKIAARGRSLDMQILHLRKCIEADTAHPCHIVTVRQVGYRFVPAPAAAYSHYPRRIA